MGYTSWIWPGVLVWTSVICISHSAEWKPPRQPKIYRGGEITTIMTPGDHAYNHAWYSVEDRNSFVFEVKSCCSAYVALSTFMEWTTDYTLEVGLGIDDNNRTAFGYTFEVGGIAIVDTPGILHCNEFRTFWIRWGARRSVEVGNGPIVGQQLITYAQNVTPPFVNAIGISSDYSNSATWRIRENAGDLLIVDTPDQDRFEAMWKSVVDRQFFTFSVTACADARVILTEKHGRTDEHIYEFVIGGWKNTRSVIRTNIKGGGRTVMASKPTTDILSCDAVITFWISWLNGEIELGYGEIHGHDNILSWKSVVPFEVRYLAIATASGNIGRWLIEDDLESVNYILTSGVAPTADPKTKYGVAVIDSPKKDLFKFGVRACTDASVLISNTESIGEGKAIELVLGAESNTQSGLRRLGDKDWLSTMETKGIIDCRETRTFWVGWHHQILIVGTGFIGSDNILMQVKLDADFDVVALSVATVNVKGVWRFRENVGERITLNTPAELTHFVHFWKTRKQDDSFVFSVKSCSDAHVMLSPVALGYDPTDEYYDILISGGNNTRSVIQRRNSHGVVEPVSRYVHTNGLLRCDSFVDLWVHWEDGIIRVGEGSTVGVSQFIWHPFESAYPVKAVSLSSGMRNPAQWRMEEDNGDVTTLNTGKISYWLAPRSQHAYVLAFKVRACSDAHVILSSKQSASTADYYEISLGIDGGKRSLLKFDNDPRDQIVSSKAVLDCKHDRQFWLHWDANSGLIRIGQGAVYRFNVLLSWTNPDPFDVQAIGLSTKNSKSGRWRLLNNAASFVQFMTPNDASLKFEYVWRSVRHTESMLFSVKTCANAYIALSQDFSLHYVVVLGGWHNTMSAINEDGKQVASSVEPNLLDCNEPRTFWVRWHAGYIVVGKGEVIGEHILMDYHPLVARNIRNAAFATHTYPGLWKLNFLEDTPAQPTISPTITPMNPSSGSLSGGAIAGIVIGVLAAVVIVGLVLLFMAHRSGRLPPIPNILRHFRKQKDDTNEIVPSSNGSTAQ